jgi:hypothetical protein
VSKQTTELIIIASVVGLWVVYKLARWLLLARARVDGTRPDGGTPAGVEIKAPLLPDFSPEGVTGVPALDLKLALRGDRGAALSILGASTRLAVLSAIIDGDAAYRGGRFERVGGTKGVSQGELRRQAALGEAAMVALRRQLPTVDARLAEHVRSDPEPGFRRACLEALVARAPDAIETAEVLQAALRDRDPDVRAVAALRSRGALSDHALGGVVADHGAPDALVAQALAALADRRRPPKVTRLARLVDRGPEVLAEVARCAGQHEGPRARALLMHLLDQTDDVVDVAAAAALGACGDLDAIPALAAHTRGAFRDRAVKRAATDAIQAIQARAGGEAGRLALVAAEEGALSLAEDEPPARR